MKIKLNIKSTIFMALIAIASLLFINISFAANTGKVMVETAKLREQANTDSKVLELASQGEEVEILKEEFETFYNYELIDHINTRIKKPESIMKKLEKKECNYTYEQMIENVNDIAGIRIICPLKKDIFSIRNIVTKLPGIKVLKEKDYVTKPKESGYSSYHLILEVPVTLSQQQIYVKVEVQIRTLAMDFWANIEHKTKYKTEGKISKKESKQLISYAKAINKIDNNMMILSSK